MKKCPRCNAQLTDTASFCGICGNALSVPSSNTPEVVRPNPLAANNEATMQSMPWSGGGAPRGTFPAPPTQPAGWSGGPQSANQAPQAGAWSQSGPANQSPFAAAPEMRPGALGRAGNVVPPSARKRRRAGRVWMSIFLSLVLLLAIVAGVWFLGVRPYLHNLAQTQLDQALAPPESQMLLAMLVLPPGSPVIHGSESAMNLYLSDHETDQVQNLHMAITPANMSLSFTVYGQNCTITVVPIVSNGQIQMTNVQVQGVLALIMSNDELTNALNSNLQTFSAQMTRQIKKITLREQAIDVQFA